MKLNQKTLLYSLVLTTTLVGCILAYLVYLLPNLYLDNISKSNIEASQTFHEAYLETGDFPIGKAPSNSSAVIVESPKDSNELYLRNGYGDIVLTVKNPRLLGLLNFMKTADLSDPNFQLPAEYQSQASLDAIFNEIQSEFDVRLVQAKNTTAQLNANSNSNYEVIDGKGYRLFVNTVEEKNNVYTNTVGLSQKNGALIVSFVPYSINKIENIKEVVFTSLPMIILSLILVSTLASLFFSRLIINPIQRLAHHTSQLQSGQLKPMDRLEIRTGDEIQGLAESVDNMYEALQASYQDLVAQHQQQELFMRATSHQLKTPVAASLLLVQSMMDGIGKYKDTEAYLPKVKEQIQSIQRLIDDLLVLNRPLDLSKRESVSVDDLLRQLVKNYNIAAENKGLDWQVQLAPLVLQTQADAFFKVLDNLVANAIEHADSAGDLRVRLSAEALVIENPGQLDPQVAESMFQPFVTSKSHLSSGGLGLYIADKYARALGCELSLKNGKGCVKTVLKFKK